MTRMRVDAKLLLKSEDDFRRLLELLRPFHLRTWKYEDFYFDTPNFLLMAKDVQLRLRVPFKSSDGKDEKLAGAQGSNMLCHVSLTLKTNSSVDVGGQTAGIFEMFPFTPKDVDDMLQEDSLVSVLKNRSSDEPAKTVLEYLTRASEEYGEELVLTRFASFETTRRQYKFVPHLGFGSAHSSDKDVASEKNKSDPPRFYVDEVPMGDFKSYEVEMQGVTDPLADVCQDLMDYLNEKGIEFTHSLSGKLNRFMTRTLELEEMKEESQCVRLRIKGNKGYEEVCRWQNEENEISLDPIPKRGAPPVDNDKPTFGVTQMASSLLGLGPLTSQASRMTHSQSVRLKRIREGNHGDEEYFENYFFDDRPNGTLAAKKYTLRLRCCNPPTAFSLELRKEKWSAGGVKGYERRRAYISGDVARLMLRDPNKFLNSLSSQSSLGHLLRQDMGLQKLTIVGYCKTHRITYNGKIIERRMVEDSQRTQNGNAGKVAARPPDVEFTLFHGPSSAGCRGEFSIQLNRIMVDTGSDPVKVAKRASEERCCSIFNPRGCSPFPREPSETESYEVKLAGLPEGLAATAEDWLVSQLHQRQVQWEVVMSAGMGQYHPSLAAA
ncbi:CYTH domain containing protein, putative [Trypanosoma equiperdum]|uniref:CYTH domain containing protein, putative n=1 Tax=Trypanosoma equiperdum TaxID=5694 RepID=A0A1G4HYU8_TRYEQ|nr:CYTH domain containing protein, putative [Trypanosoma equiperdum]